MTKNQKPEVNDDQADEDKPAAERDLTREQELFKQKAKYKRGPNVHSLRNKGEL